MKMWTGRLKNNTNKIADDFNSSIQVDCRMYREDIKGSLAHSKMLKECDIISEEDFEKISSGLKNILEDIENGKLEINYKAEDIHMFIEEELTNRIGDYGKKLHTARSRNDQVALDIKMYLKKEIKNILNLLFDFNNALINLSKENTDTIMPGYTHLQVAQPITFAHHIMSYVQMFTRDIKRLIDCYNRMDECPLGACALATTTYPIDRFFTTKELGFQKPTKNSLDSVSDRDYIMELNFDLSMIMTHLSRLSEEVILWSSQEFKFIELDDAFSTGSSIMPQKKNPDMAELVRGKTGRVIGNLNAGLIMLKGLPLAYNKDMQEDKENIFDSIDNTNMSLEVFIGMIKTLKVNKENMCKKAENGYINATDCADYLVKKGLAFRDAYRITGEIVSYGIEEEKSLTEISLDEYKKFSPKFEVDVYKYIDLDYSLEQRKVYGGPSKQSVEKQIDETIEELKKLKIILQ